MQLLRRLSQCAGRRRRCSEHRRLIKTARAASSTSPIMGCASSRGYFANDMRANVFPVQMFHPNGKRLDGQLEVTTTDLILYRKHALPVRWPLLYLRRYGWERNLFSFEAGRRCRSGPGIFTFKCHQAQQLFLLIQTNLHYLGREERDRVNQMLAQMRRCSQPQPRCGSAVSESRLSTGEHISRHCVSHAPYYLPASYSAQHVEMQHVQQKESSPIGDMMSHSLHSYSQLPKTNTRAACSTMSSRCSVNTPRQFPEPCTPSNMSQFDDSDSAVGTDLCPVSFQGRTFGRKSTTRSLDTHTFDRIHMESLRNAWQDLGEEPYYVNVRTGYRPPQTGIVAIRHPPFRRQPALPPPRSSRSSRCFSTPRRTHSQPIHSVAVHSYVNLVGPHINLSEAPLDYVTVSIDPAPLTRRASTASSTDHSYTTIDMGKTHAVKPPTLRGRQDRIRLINTGYAPTPLF